MRTPRPVRRLLFFKELARADGGLAQAAGGRRGSACGQEIIFNKLGEKHEAEAGKDCVPQPVFWLEASRGGALHWPNLLTFKSGPNCFSPFLCGNLGQVRHLGLWGCPEA